MCPPNQVNFSKGVNRGYRRDRPSDLFDFHRLVPNVFNKRAQILRRAMMQVVQYIRARVETGERGASLVEYALLVALLAMVCLVAITYFGQATGGRLSSSGSSITSAG
jgi:pilus assembly protein Flp/PilA